MMLLIKHLMKKDGSIKKIRALDIWSKLKKEDKEKYRQEVIKQYRKVAMYYDYDSKNYEIG